MLCLALFLSARPGSEIVQGKRADVQPLAEDGNTTYIRFFHARPSRIRPGESAVLSWRVIGEADAILLIRDRQLPIIGHVAAFDKMTVTPDKTATYQLLVRFGGQTVEKEVTVQVTKATVLRQAQACLYITDGRCVEPPRRDDEGDGKCFYTDPQKDDKRLWEDVKILLRFRGLPTRKHQLETNVWKGASYPANNYVARYSKSFTFENDAENWRYDFPVTTDGKTKYWRVGIFLDKHWVGEVEFRVCR
jgi:hypothetical protein